LAAQGRHGQKTGSGFYRYDGRTAQVDEQVQHVCAALAAERGVERRQTIANNEIVERCLLPLINEGARILDEGVAQRASDIDVVWLLGYGFPAALGGPMYHADVMGTAAVRERLDGYAKARGNRYGYWTPAPSLIRLAESSRRFAEAYPASR
jgi:3-hydroxyacyl-CoA dehydrogenase